MYVPTFQEFVAEAEKMFTSDPQNTRYSLKFRHCDGLIVLKVTDNRTCISYKTKDVADLPMIERLNNTFLHQCTEISPEAVAMELDAREKQQQQQQQAKKQHHQQKGKKGKK